MEKIKEYSIVSTYDTKNFTNKINEQLKDGWFIFGNISTTTLESNIAGEKSILVQFTQVLVKY